MNTKSKVAVLLGRSDGSTGGRGSEPDTPQDAEADAPRLPASPAHPKTETTTAPAKGPVKSDAANSAACGEMRGGSHVWPSQTSFTDPGDGYDSAIRHHADFERGVL